MKKNKFLLLILVLFAGVLVITGCNKKEEEKQAVISGAIGDYTVTLTVPADEEGKAKYNFVFDKPDEARKKGSLYLVLEDTTLVFNMETWTYQTATKYKEKYGTKDASYANYIEWMKDSTSGIKLSGMEEVEFNGRKGLRYYDREGSFNNYTYYGYFYFFGLDDINPKMRLNMTVNYINKEEWPTEIKEFDDLTLKIIKTLQVSK